MKRRVLTQCICAMLDVFQFNFENWSTKFTGGIRGSLMRVFVLVLKVICQRVIRRFTATRAYCFECPREASISCPDKEDTCDYPVFQCCHFLLVQLRYWQLLSWTWNSPLLFKPEDFLLCKHTIRLLILKKKKWNPNQLITSTFSKHSCVNPNVILPRKLRSRIPPLEFCIKYSHSLRVLIYYQYEIFLWYFTYNSNKTYTVKNVYLSFIFCVFRPGLAVFRKIRTQK